MKDVRSVATSGHSALPSLFRIRLQDPTTIGLILMTVRYSIPCPRSPQWDHASITWDAPTAVLSLAGEIDLLVRPALDAQIDRILGCPAPAISVDLVGVTFLDSAGSTPLRRLCNAAPAHGAEVWLRNASRFVAQTLRIVGLGAHLRCEEPLPPA